MVAPLLARLRHVIGARAVGLDAAWVRRSDAEIFDPWGIEPTLTVATLDDLADKLTPM